MKLVRFLIGSLLVAGMLAVAPAAFADEDDGGGGRRGPFNQEPFPGGPVGGWGEAQCWNPTCAASTWNEDMETSACDYFPYNGRCFCNFMTTPDGGACEAT
jgi:hypothetical protein